MGVGQRVCRRAGGGRSTRRAFCGAIALSYVDTVPAGAIPMRMRWMRLTISAAAVTVVGAWSLIQFGSHEVARLTQRTSELEREKQELHENIQRLGASRRVAQVSILVQQPSDKGQTGNRLRWQELRSDGPLSPPRSAES